MEFPANYLESKTKKKAPPTYLHEIVRQVCDYLYGVQDKDCYRMWIGIGTRIGAGQLKSKLDYVKEKGIKSPRYLLAMCKNN